MNNKNAEKEVDDFRTAIGCVAELARMYRDDFIDNGFTREEACAMALSMIKAQLFGGQ